MHFVNHMTDPSAQPRRSSVLVIDSVASARAALTRVLVELGFSTVTAVASADQAIADGRTVDADLIVIDTLKGSAGTLLKRIRRGQGPIRADVPVVLVTAAVEPGQVRAARDAGVSAVLAKPIHRGSYRRYIAAALRDPRPFIKSTGYVGPDRRTRDKPEIPEVKESAIKLRDAVRMLRTDLTAAERLVQRLEMENRQLRDRVAETGGRDRSGERASFDRVRRLVLSRLHPDASTANDPFTRRIHEDLFKNVSDAFDQLTAPTRH